MSLHPALSLLADPAHYSAQIDRLRNKYSETHQLDALGYRALTLGDLGTRDAELATLLARTVSRGEYRFSPVVIRAALINGKWRNLSRSNLLDTIVLGVLSQSLGMLAEPVLSSRVYSYRPGRSSWENLQDLREFLVAHVRERSTTERGLYVLHRDIRNYGESIPTGEASALWTELSAALTAARVPESHPVRPLMRGAIRPEGRTPDGEPCEVPGVPTGSSVQPVACNLYLSAVDRLAESIPGGFYARFGDDMLFCHPDADVARRMAGEIDAVVTRLELEVKAEKRRNFYVTVPGRASAVWPESKPTSQFDYLGFRVDLLGNVALKADKSRRFLREIRARIRATTRFLSEGAPHLPLDEERARSVCEVVTRALDPSCPVCDPAAGVLRYVVADRSYLRYLDYAIALSVAESLSGKRGPRAFREVPYVFLRNRAQLPSLIVLRNARPPSPRST